MCTRQRELRFVVIKIRIVPRRCIVTHFAIVRILLLGVVVRAIVIRFVARPAIGGRASVTICVTLETVRLNVCTG